MKRTLPSRPLHPVPITRATNDADDGLPARHDRALASDPRRGSPPMLSEASLRTSVKPPREQRTNDFGESSGCSLPHA